MTLIDKAEALARCPFCGETLFTKAADSRSDLLSVHHPLSDCLLSGDSWWLVPKFTAAWNRRAALPARGVWVKPDRATFDAMCAMRNSINEYIPMPSLESDLLQGPENSVFCATVASAVIAEVSRLRGIISGTVVKQLEWHNFDAWTHWAEGACGTYHVEERNGYWQVELRVGGLVHGVTQTDDTTPADLDAAKAAAQADYEARILSALEPAPAPTDAAQDDDPECTDCGGTGITYQTERRCACQPTDAAQAPFRIEDMTLADLMRDPLYEEATTPATDAAQAREAAARLLLDMLHMRNGAHEGVTKDDAQAMWEAASTRVGYAAVDAFLRSIIGEARP